MIWAVQCFVNIECAAVLRCRNSFTPEQRCKQAHCSLCGYHRLSEMVAVELAQFLQSWYISGSLYSNNVILTLAKALNSSELLFATASLVVSRSMGWI